MNWYKKARVNILDCDDCGKSTLMKAICFETKYGCPLRQKILTYA